MSAFVCGYALAEGNTPPVQFRNLAAFRDVAGKHKLRIHYGEGAGLPRMVAEILANAVQETTPGAVSFLITTDDLPDVSDGVIDADDDLVGASIPVREAVLRRLAPLRRTVKAAFDECLLKEMTLVTSLGLDVSYPVRVVGPTELAAVIADAYEREDQVPSLCVIVRHPRECDGRASDAAGKSQ